MFSKISLEEMIEQTEKKIKDFEDKNKEMEQVIQSQCKHLQLTIEEIKSYCNNPENFPIEVWQELQQYRQELDAKLQQELDSYNNPTLTQKKRLSLKLPSHAIFVR